MKKLLLALLVSQAAMAQRIVNDDIVCSFTEPFLTVTYSPAKQVFEVSEMMGEGAPIVHQSTFLTTGVPGQLVVMSHDREILLELSHDGKGSDGMSDEVYPVSAKLTTKAYSPLLPLQAGFDLSGGCRFIE